jgi:hypothetical protein
VRTFTTTKVPQFTRDIAIEQDQPGDFDMYSPEMDLDDEVDEPKAPSSLMKRMNDEQKHSSEVEHKHTSEVAIRHSGEAQESSRSQESSRPQRRSVQIHNDHVLAERLANEFDTDPDESYTYLDDVESPPDEVYDPRIDEGDRTEDSKATAETLELNAVCTSGKIAEEECIGDLNAAVEREPSNWREAIQQAHWKLSMQKEIDCLVNRGTWEIVNRPTNKRVMKNVWAFKTKRDQNNVITKYKSRLNAAGYSQQAGIDYRTTFAGVGKKSTFRLLLSLVAKFRLTIRQADFESAFLNGRIEDGIELYMEQPSGFTNGRKDHVCLLKRSIYGLKQAASVWAKCLSKTLESLGYRSSSADKCFFIASNFESGLPCFIYVYVDDVLMISAVKSKHEVEKLTRLLQERYSLKYTDDVTHFLGLEINRDVKGVYLGQEAYALNIVQEFGKNAIPAKSLSGIYHVDTSKDDNVDEATHRWYRAVIGALLYLSTMTRPDLCLSIGILAKHVSSPKEAHVRMANRVLGYVKSNPSIGIFYEASDGCLIGSLLNYMDFYSDSDYAGDLDTRRSRTGIHITFAGAAIHWRSKQHATISLSSTEAEWYAAVDTAKEYLHFRILAYEIGNARVYDGLNDAELGTVPILVDNTSAILRAQPGEHSEAFKHVAIRYMWIQEKVKDGTLMFKYIPTADNLADLYTKPHTGSSTARFACRMGLRDKASLSIMNVRENVELK